jgi:hypothetical protein
MGRPIKAKYFGNLNNPYHRYGAGVSGTGGEALASVTITNSGTHYSAGTTAVVSRPDLNIDSNTTATISLTINTGTLGNIATVSVVSGGAGYINTPTIALTTASAVTSTVTTNTTATITMSSVAGIYVGMQAVGTGINAGATYVTNVAGSVVSLSANNANSNLTGNSIQFIDRGASAVLTAVLTSTTNNSIDIIAWAPQLNNLTANSGGSAIASDILRQEGSRSYRVKNNQGFGRVKLVAKVPAIGEANIIATDANGNTYYVTKLTARKAYLTRQTQNGANAWLFATGGSAKWSLTTAASGQVSLASD